ncbi:hypothetical protein ACFLUB_04270 [Chloroflexota bacterium]
MADYWEGNHFICDGIAWGVAPDLSTFCAGIIKAPASSQNAAEALPAKKDIVLSQRIKGKTRGSEKRAVVLSQKHPGGRPVKQGEVSKRTEYRRKQRELQGVLC